MASNNYYGFTHAGTQYGATYTPVAAVASPTGYAMSAQMYSPASVANRTAYEQTYQQTTPNAASNNYAYNRSQQSASAVGYVATDAPQYQSAAPNNAYPYTSAGVSGYTNSYSSVVTNYAATALYNQQSTATPSDSVTSAAIYSSNNKTTNWNFKKAMKGNKPKMTNKAQQLHYCEVCKISCAGPQTYKEHLEGQRHKKKEAQLKSGSAQTNTKRHGGPGIGGISLRCELCDVTCTGNDAYAAHIRGAKHQKVVKLHTKLGKPIPSTDPVVVSPNVSKSTVAKIQSAAAAVTQTANIASKIKVLGTPRISFIGGGRLHTTNLNETKDESYGENNNNNNNNNNSCNNNSQQNIPQTQTTESLTTVMTDLDKSSEAQPVGQDYIDEIRAEEGKALSFHCKLCDCRFNDPNAKEMHLKGRRHRLQYKKKVDPNLVVDVKPSLKHRKMGDIIKDRRFNYKRDAHYWNDWYANSVSGGRYSDYRHIPPPHLAIPPPPPPPPLPHMMTPPPPPPPPPCFGSGFMGNGAMISHYRRGGGGHTGSWDDSHIMQKHAEICPKEEELDEIHHLVSCVERALKLVSDKLSDQDSTNAMNDIIKRELGDIVDANAVNKETEKATATASAKVELEGKEEEMQTQTQSDAQSEPKSSAGGVGVGVDDPQHQFRLLKGLMRVGALAKGLLLTGEREVDLVVICAQKPNKDLLQRIVDYIPSQLQSVSATESFEIVMKAHEASLSISTTTEPKVTANVTLTSPLVREEWNVCDTTTTTTTEMVNESNKSKQLLEREKCLIALAALRHSKWFQARVSNLHPCCIIIRLLRDLCKRLPTWAKLNLWSIELLCEKVISSAGEPLSPGEALRHTLESIASGLLLPGGAGLLDPCEKEPTDALRSLDLQQREDITASAQHALRLIAFRQIYKILGVDPLPQRNRKRRLDSENGNALDNDSDSKKDKKEQNNFADNISKNVTNAAQVSSS